jgi:cellulose synthase/poly-beta-1,6-N-acetylglucosamine synthase-like glycosyltransferase
MIGEYLPQIALAAWLIMSAVSCYGAYFYLRGVGHRYDWAASPAAAVIVPMRGVPENLAELWATLHAQTYPRARWRLIFVVESEADPAHAAIVAQLQKSLPAASAEIVVAGNTTRCSQLNHNYLAAIRRLRPEDAVVVFAVADVVPPPEWLDETIHPINTPTIWLASAYPLMVPTDSRLSTAVSCEICMAMATVPRYPERLSIAWGGTMALRQSTLKTLDLDRWWGRTISNDSTLTRAVWEKGGTVFGNRVMLVPSPTSVSWRELLRLWSRWFLNARLYLPRHWLAAAAASLVPPIGWAAAIPLAWTGDKLAIGALVLAIGLHHARATIRGRLRRTLWPNHDDRLIALVDRWAAPLCTLLRAAIIWSTLFARTTEWAGRLYRIDGPHRIRVIRGPTPAR